jgi:Sec-independent protein translocase protein TatA
MASKYDYVITPEQEAAIKTIQDGFVDISGLQEELNIGSYQYARTLVENDTNGLGTNAVVLFGRKLVAKAAIGIAKEMREQREADRQAVRENKTTKKAAGKGKKAKKEAEEPTEDLDELLTQ